MEGSRFVKEHKPLIIIAALAVCGLLVFCLRPSSPVYRAIHKGAADKLQESLMSGEWVDYKTVSLVGIERSSGEVLEFSDSTVSYYLIPDLSLSMGGNEFYAKKLQSESPYELADGKKMVVDVLGIKLNTDVTFEENGNVMVLSPSITDGEKNKKWYRKSYYVEQHPEHAAMFGE